MVLLITSIQVSIFLIFILSAVLKLKDMSAFANSVLEYRLLPKPLSLLYAWVAPFAEIAAGVLILFPALVQLGSLLLFALLISFFYAVSYVMIKKLDVECGCYGKWLESRADGFTLGKIIALTGMTAAMFIYVPAVGSKYDIISILLGIALSAVFFAMQMLWNFFQDNKNLLT
jgi:uncharacterized membrane protein